jgi:[ribosomal protein S5]-alanine N-acetyltransferase
MSATLHTERLSLRPWSESDTGLLGTLAMTPAMMRYIGDGATWTDARVKDVAARNHEHWRLHGFGWRVATLAPGHEPIGFIALSFAGEGSGVDADEYEIGWWLAPTTWGRGLAREGAAALRDEAFERLEAPSIVARIAPGNDASLGVAHAIGLTHESESVGRGGEPIAVLRLSAETWRRDSPRSAPPAGRA